MRCNVLIFIVSVVFLILAPIVYSQSSPNPGHPAGQVGGGTFNASYGNFLFPALNVTFDTNVLHVDSTANRVGIGTSAPSAELEIANGGSLKLNGGDASGEGNIQLGATASAGYDTNLIYLTGTGGTGGYMFGSTPAFLASNGPYFGGRGNTYSAFANQRGLLFFSAGNVGGASAGEAEIRFLTGADVLRMVIDKDGNIGIGNSRPNSTLNVVGNINATGGSLIFDNEIMPDGANCSAGQILKKTAHNDWDCATDTGSDAMSGFKAAGDTGASQDINNSDTLTIAGGTGITTVASATDTVTVNFNSSELGNDAINESKINFTTSCLGANNVLQTSGTDLVCSTETDPGVDTVTNKNVCYGTGTAVTCADADFNWDTSNKLGIGTASPADMLHLQGGGLIVNLSVAAAKPSLNIAVFGMANYGVYGRGAIIGVVGNSSGYENPAPYSNTGILGTGSNYGIIGTGPSFGAGIVGNASGSGSLSDAVGAGIYGTGATYGVYGKSAVHAGYFAGNVTITGNARFDGEIMPDGSTCGAGQILKRTGANDWDCVDYVPGGTGYVNGSGSSGYIARWNSTTSLNNSVIYESANNIGIGTASPSQKLHVAGNATVSDSLSVYGGSFNYMGMPGYPIRLAVGNGTNNISIYSNSSLIGILSDVWISSTTTNPVPSGVAMRFINSTGGESVIANMGTYDSDYGWAGLSAKYKNQTGTPEALLATKDYAVVGKIESGGTGLAGYFVGDVNVTSNLRFDGEIMPDGELCSNGDILMKNGANDWNCTTESDPQVDELGAGGWCKSNDGSNIDCMEDAPVTAEVDPQVDTVTDKYVCYGTGSAVTCADADFNWDATNNKLGLKTSSPGEMLTVAGNASFEDTTLVVASNKVGIGTRSPTTELHVQGHIFGNYSGTTDPRTSAGVSGSGTEGVRGAYRLDSNIYGFLGNSNYGVYGAHDATHYGYIGSSNVGVLGSSNLAPEEAANTGVQGAGSLYGVYGVSGLDGVGVMGNNSGGVLPASLGKVGIAGLSSGYGVYGVGGVYAGYFDGQVNAQYVANSDKNVILANASQAAAAGDFNNIAIVGIAAGHPDSGGYGYGVGVQGIGVPINSYGSMGVYAALNNAPAPNITGVAGGYDVALYSDARSLGYAGILMGGMVGINTTAPVSTLSVNGVGVAGAGIYGSGSLYGVYGRYDSNNYGYLGASSYGVYGASNNMGVFGQYDGNNFGILGQNTLGVSGYSSASGGIGVKGDGASYGVYGVTSSGLGVYGVSTNNIGVKGEGGVYGVEGRANSGKIAVYANSSNGNNYAWMANGSYGVYGRSIGNVGVYGMGGSSGTGIVGIASSSVPSTFKTDTGVYGYGATYGLYGVYDAGNYGYVGASGTGVYGNGSLYGVRGQGGSDGVYGDGEVYGVQGVSTSSTGAGLAGSNAGYSGVISDGNIIIWNGGLLVSSDSTGGNTDLSDGNVYVRDGALNVCDGACTQGITDGNIYFEGSLARLGWGGVYLNDSAYGEAIVEQNWDGTYGDWVKVCHGGAGGDNCMQISENIGFSLFNKPGTEHIRLGINTTGSWMCDSSCGTKDIAVAGGDLYVDNDFEVDGITYHCDATCGTVNNIASAGEVYIDNDLEVDGVSYLGETDVCDTSCGTISYATAAGELYVDNDLEVDGIPYFYGMTQNASAYRSVVVDITTGRLYYSSNIISSRRYKENISDLDLGLDAVMQLRPISFDFKKEVSDGPREVGFIAEEVENVSPLLVGYAPYTDKNNNTIMLPEAVKYDKMTAVLTKAMQEQQTKIEQQKSDIEALKTKTRDLEAEMTLLKGKVEEIKKKI